MKDQGIVVGIGEALWDMFSCGKRLGGAPANFAFHISQLGLKSVVVTAVGNDDNGFEIINNFNNNGLDHITHKVDHPTGIVDVTINDEGIPDYKIRENAAWDYIPFSKELNNLSDRVSAVCFGTLAQRSIVSRNTILTFLETVSSENGAIKIFDINLRGSFYSKSIIVNSLELCNILKANVDELEILSRMFNIENDDIQSRCHKIIDLYDLQMLILTCGVDGSYIFYKNEFDVGVSFIPTPIVKVIDTVGAGDAFTASFIASILKGESIEKAHNFAVCYAAFVCTRQGAMPRIDNFNLNILLNNGK